ncbi:hypothetical protein [Mycoplasma procyoni]|uniref:hypothetical protein n=1 Tax=Mycoplasma procyoni TaxID=568784 RepID=UPI00197C2FFF|nr:hypothetical protein [Mycoplasma procyoni]MBN3534734.1 hypothetical protein [Mycoplasma procyoni]
MKKVETKIIEMLKEVIEERTLNKTQKTEILYKRTLEVKFPLSLQRFYENMYVSSSVHGYSLDTGVAKCLKIYMFKDSYNLMYQKKKLNNLQMNLIWIKSAFDDFSNKRKFIKIWIEECIKAHNLKGDFSINDFEQKMRERKILVIE